MISAKFKRAVRDGSPDVRHLYVAARKARALLRDHHRRAALRALPVTEHVIPEDAGFLVLPAGTLGGVEPVVDQSRRVLAEYDRDRPPAGKNKKRFLVNVLHEPALTLTSPIIQFALRSDLLAVASRYLGLVPLLTAIKVFHSDTVDGVPTSSQLYHCDAEDLRQVKIFVYCTDVDERSGPFTLLDAQTTARVQKQTDYRYGSRLTDDQVHRVCGREGERAILGRAGTVAFIDTSRCFHFGSRVAADAPPRLVAMIQYQTPYSFMIPSDYRAAAPFRHLLDPSLGRLQRLALGE